MKKLMMSARRLSRIGAIRAAGLAIVALSLGVVVAQPEQLSSADAAELQRQIDEQLNKGPGGVQIDTGAVILTFPLPGQRQAPPPSAEALQLQQMGEGEALTLGPEPITDVEGCPKGIFTIYGYRSPGFTLTHSFLGGARQ